MKSVYTCTFQHYSFATKKKWLACFLAQVVLMRSDVSSSVLRFANQKRLIKRNQQVVADTATPWFPLKHVNWVSGYVLHHWFCYQTDTLNDKQKWSDIINKLCFNNSPLKNLPLLDFAVFDRSSQWNAFKEKKKNISISLQ